MDTSNLQSVALFPIPNCTVFPGMVFPLHVFEPRYRDMIRYCIKHKLPLAICHTEKTIHHTQVSANKQDALNQNQDTYEPVKFFGAGRCELVSTTDDGRLLVNVYIDQRLQLIEQEQMLPFMIAKCKPVMDVSLTDDEAVQAKQLKEKILHRLVALSGEDQELLKRLESDTWKQQSPHGFSFEVFTVIQLPAEIQQALLEERSTLNRLQTLLNIINE